MFNGDHQYEQKEQNLILMSAENHTVDKFHDEATCSTKEIALVTDKDSVENSSTDCSDVEDDIDEEEETSIEKGWKLRNLPIPSTIFQTVATTNDGVVLPTADPSNFGDVRVKDSTNVHLGNKTFYKGQITIKQFIYTNPTSIQDAGKFDADRVCNENVSDLSSSKNDGAASGLIFPQNTELNNAGKFDADRVCNENVPDLSSSKNDGAASGPIFPQNTELNNAGKFDADRVYNENVLDLSSSSGAENDGAENDGASSGPIFEQNTELKEVLQSFWRWTSRCAALLYFLFIIIVATIVFATVLPRFFHEVVFQKIPDSSHEDKAVWQVTSV